MRNSGILVPFKDINKLAYEIIKLLKDERLRKIYSEKALKNVEHYSAEKGAERYYEYFLKKKKEKSNHA
ncbi:MAG: hypothetical protein Q9M89_01130 [Persephonella sp.]|nr:hypothetical protein [Persephonella sp.]